MAYQSRLRAIPRARAAQTAAVLDAGLRAYMLRVYNWMASGLLLTGIVAYGIANTGVAATRSTRCVQTARRSAARARPRWPTWPCSRRWPS